jgi:uncharacterized linocin/CFP29 family protein
MSDSGKPIEWTPQQWQTVQQTVYEEARKARVAARFLPLYGPIPADAETVPAETLNEGPPEEQTEPRLHVDDTSTLRITTVAVNVQLNSQQVAQPDLSAALTLFRRAANIIARVEDALIFRGEKGRSLAIPKLYHATRGTSVEGLYDRVRLTVEGAIEHSDELLRAVAEGITVLEDKGYVAPYALALGNKLFVTAETPNKDSLVLPSDRIRPLIEGPLVRTGTLPEKTGILFSLAGKPIEIVVAKEIGVTFLQVSAEPRWIYRVSERFVLRAKEPDSMVRIGQETEPVAAEKSPQTKNPGRP